MSDHQYGFETLCLHAGQQPDPYTGSRAVPLYQTTSFVFDSTDHAASLFNLQTFGNIYGRMMNPTTAVFEERMAALENGRAAVAAASGMGAQTAALLTLLEAGDEVVASRTLYGGTFSQLDVTFRKMGIQTRFVDIDEPESIRDAIGERTKLVYAETIGNPVGNVLDVRAVADIAHEAGLPLVVDNTMATPYLCRPMDHGADIVVHSATKFIGGHGTALGGVVVESGRFPWDNGRFPGMVEPSEGYHGVRFYETFGDFGFTMKVRCETLRTLGPTIAPMHSWLFLQGLETLPLRMERHCENALRVAEFLRDHPRVAWVSYAGLDDSPYAGLRARYLPKGAGGIVSFGIEGGHDSAVRFIESVQFLSHLANIGDAKTLVIHPASTTHRQLDEAQQIAAGVPPDMIRLSIGLETIDDILWDIDQALAASMP